MYDEVKSMFMEQFLATLCHTFCSCTCIKKNLVFMDVSVSQSVNKLSHDMPVNRENKLCNTALM
jgi:hypothetical protein